MGSPLWSRDGMIAVGNAHKGKVKLTFAYGAKLADPDKLFNAGLEGNMRRAIDFLEGDKVDAASAEEAGPRRDRIQPRQLKKNARKAPAKKASGGYGREAQEAVRHSTLRRCYGTLTANSVDDGGPRHHCARDVFLHLP